MNPIPVSKLLSLRKEGKSFAEIGRTLGFSANTLKSFARRNKALFGQVTTDRCDYCGARMPSKGNKRFCSDKCRYAWNYRHRNLGERNATYKDCPVCGMGFYTYASSDKVYCGRECYLVGRFGWK